MLSIPSTCLPFSSSVCARLLHCGSHWGIYEWHIHEPQDEKMIGTSLLAVVSLRLQVKAHTRDSSWTHEEQQKTNTKGGTLLSREQLIQISTYIMPWIKRSACVLNSKLKFSRWIAKGISHGRIRTKEAEPCGCCEVTGELQRWEWDGRRERKKRPWKLSGQLLYIAGFILQTA